MGFFFLGFFFVFGVFLFFFLIEPLLYFLGNPICPLRDGASLRGV